MHVGGDERSTRPIAAPRSPRLPRHPSPKKSCHFFFLMTRPPPTSTLFPYTTLFRSRRDGMGRPGAGPGSGEGPDQGDRKSTRLNSSHITISYAVFCLKKKKYPNPELLKGASGEEIAAIPGLGASVACRALELTKTSS